MKKLIIEHGKELVVDMRTFENVTKIKKKDIVSQLQGGRDWNVSKDCMYLTAEGVRKIMSTMKDRINDDIMELLEHTFGNYYKKRLQEVIQCIDGREDEMRRLYSLAKMLFK